MLSPRELLLQLEHRGKEVAVFLDTLQAQFAGPKCQALEAEHQQTRSARLQRKAKAA